MNETVLKRRAAHHTALASLLPIGSKQTGLQTWRKLRRLEAKVYAACEAYSNDASFGLERWEAVKDEARKELAAIFGGSIPVGVFINGDPRGHSLKMDCDETPIPQGMEKDWGGNGILAADIN